MNELDDLIPLIELDVKEEEQAQEEKEPIVYAEDSDATAIAFYEEMKQRGYADDTVEFDGKWSTLDKYLEEFPQRIFSTVVAQLPEVSKDVMRFIASSGDNVTKDEMKNFFNEYFKDDNVQVETLDDARSYMQKVYEEQGLTKRAIAAMLDDLEDEDKLLDVAKKHVEEKEKPTEKLIQEKERQLRENENRSKQLAISIDQELSNTGWKTEKINEVRNLLKGGNINNRLKEIVADTKAYVQLANILSLYDSKNKSFNLDFLTKQSETKQANTLKDRIEKNLLSSPTMATNASFKENPKLKDLIPIED